MKVMRNSSFLALLFGFNMLAGTLSSVLLAHVLSLAELGIYGAAFRAYSWLTAFAVFLLPPVLVRYVAELRGAGRMAQAWRLLIASVKIQIAIAGVIAAAVVVWRFVLGNEFFLTRGSFIAIIAGFLLFAFWQLLEGFVRGCQDFRSVALAAFASGVFRLLGLGLLLFFGGTVAAALWILAGGNLAALVVLCLVVVLLLPRAKRTQGEPLQDRVAFRKRLVEYAGTMGVAGFLSLIVWNYVEVFLLGWFWKESPRLEEQLAFYTLAISVSALPVRLGKAISQTLLPAFAEMYGGGEMDRLRRGYHHSTVLSTVVGAFLCLGGIALAQPLFRFLFPDNLLPAAACFQLLMIPALMVSVNHAGGAALPAVEGHRFLLLSTALLAPLNLILDFILIPEGGALGASTVNAVMQSLAVGTGLWYVASRRNLGFPAAQVARALAAAAVAWGLGYATAVTMRAGSIPDIISLLLASVVAVVIYLPALRVLHVLGREERSVLRNAGQLLPSSMRPAYLRVYQLAVGGS
jgi:O-antigen/teichoic acid export membrane protein